MFKFMMVLLASTIENDNMFVRIVGNAIAVTLGLTMIVIMGAIIFVIIKVMSFFF